MRRSFAFALAWIFAAGAAHAEAAPSALGRIDIAGRGWESYCTGTLVAADLVLTAGHCVVDPDEGTLLTPGAITFRALRVGALHLLSRRVAEILAEPGFDPAAWRSREADPEGAGPLWAFDDDIVLLRLGVPVAADLIRPARVSTASDYRGPVRLEGYRGEGGRDFHRYEGCGAIPLSARGLALDCLVFHGTSGAPVLAPGAGGEEIIAVASVMVEFSVWMKSFAPRVTRARLDAILAGPPPEPGPRTPPSFPGHDPDHRPPQRR